MEEVQRKDSPPPPPVPQDLYRNALKNILEIEKSAQMTNAASPSTAAGAGGAVGASSAGTAGAGSGAGAGAAGGSTGAGATGASKQHAAPGSSQQQQQQHPMVDESMAPSTAVGFSTPALHAWREETKLSLAAEWPSAVAGGREGGSGEGGERRSQRRASRRMVGAGAGPGAGADRRQNLRE